MQLNVNNSILPVILHLSTQYLLYGHNVDKQIGMYLQNLDTRLKKSAAWYLFDRKIDVLFAEL